MNDLNSPSLIARETLKRLAASHVPPTPANYQACYNEIAELPNSHPFSEAPLRELLAELKPHNEAQRTHLAKLSAAVSRHSWQGVRESLCAFAEAGATAIPAGANASAGSAEVFTKFAHFVEVVLPVLGDAESPIRGDAGELIALLRQPSGNLDRIQSLLASLARHARFAVEEQSEIKDALLMLLHLIIENIGELSIDDSWLKGQIDGLLASVAPPLTLRHLDEMERRLRDVMEKQGRSKSRAVQAQAEMRQMLAEFIERLGSMNQSSVNFEGRIERSARQIEQASSIEDLRPLLGEVIAATQAMALDSAQSREQLKSLQDKVMVTEAELVHLHQELDSASALARHDPLTDALNRKGLDEAMEREMSSMRRKEAAFSVSLLDIDNFKKLNDSLGHEAGDRALIHLAEVARRSLRPSDTLARYGGEEFVVLMPDTQLEQGIEVMARLQRELTKSIYMAGGEKVLITFSAGVAQVGLEESGSEAIRRADQAMYLAKRAGKNRVVGG